jgi:hypothetical protein
MNPRWRSPRTAIILAALFLIGLWHIRSTHIQALVPQSVSKPSFDITAKGNLEKQLPVLSTTTKTSALTPVPLEAHIMSKCPDARDCLVDLVVPAMSRINPSHVNFTLSYIGTATDHDDGVECRHGPDECLGNILQLCAAQLYPDPKQYLGFAYCMIKRLEEIPHRALIQECAAEYGIEFSRLNDCASKDDGSVGIGLLRDSVTRTKDAGVTLSCTVCLVKNALKEWYANNVTGAS